MVNDKRTFTVHTPYIPNQFFQGRYRKYHLRLYIKMCGSCGHCHVNMCCRSKTIYPKCYRCSTTYCSLLCLEQHICNIKICDELQKQITDEIEHYRNTEFNRDEEIKMLKTIFSELQKTLQGRRDCS